MVKFALRTPYTILVAALVMIVLGLYTMVRMPQDILPTFKLPAVMVVTTYSGMPTRSIEFDITNRLERWLSQAAGLDHIESRSMIGVSILNCFFEPGFDPNSALAQISTLVMSDLHYLPPGTQPPIVISYDPTASLPVGLLTVNTPGLDEAAIWDESNFIVRNQLNSVPGAVAPVVFGGKLRQIMTYLDPQALQGYNLSPMDVVSALRTGNTMIPTGDVKIGKYDYSVTSNGMVASVDSFDQIPIKVSNGAAVFIKDVGKTQDSSATQTNLVQVDGVKQTYIPLFRRMGASTLSVVKNIKETLPKVLAMLPEKSELKLVFDQSPKVRDAIFDVMRELIVGVLLASLVIYFFLGSFRPTIIASLIIPLSIIGGMVALYYSGNTLNLMTLGGLALITGPLIDKAVVALENIERHLDLGASVLEAADRGTSEVQLPVLMASLALIVVFFPVTFFEGLGKFLFIPMAVTVAVTEIISYFAVMTMVPLLAERLLKSKAEHAHHKVNKFVKIFNGYFERLKASYERALDWCLHNPQVTVTLSTLCLVGSLFLVPALGTEFFPAGDNGQFYIRMREEVGTRIERTGDRVQEISQVIHELLPNDAVENILANTGVINSWAAAYSPNSAAHDSLIEVALSEHAKVSADKAIRILREELHKRYPQVQFSFSIIDPVASALNYGSLSPIDLRIISPKLDKGQEIAKTLLDQMRGVNGIVDSFVEQELTYPALHINVDRTKAAYLGLTANEVIENVITAMNSSVLFAPNFWDDPGSGNNYFIGAMYPEKDFDSVQSIANIPLLASNAKIAPGMSIPLLRNLAEITNDTVPVEISHYNIQRTFDVMANVQNRDIGSVASDIDKVVKKLDLPKGYSVSWVGQVASMRASFSSMGGGMALSLILIFLLLVAQLKSFVDPLLILATVPMGFIGTIWMLFMTGTTLNIQSMMGMIMLIGIVVSNTVILTDYANQLIASGKSYYDAIREAGQTRMRPILMTAISAVMALLPSSLGGANAPLARAVIGGLLTSTVLSLLFLPALFILVKTRKSNQRKTEPVTVSH